MFIIVKTYSLPNYKQLTNFSHTVRFQIKLFKLITINMLYNINIKMYLIFYILCTISTILKTEKSGQNKSTNTIECYVYI